MDVTSSDCIDVTGRVDVTGSDRIDAIGRADVAGSDRIIEVIGSGRLFEVKVMLYDGWGTELKGPKEG